MLTKEYLGEDSLSLDDWFTDKHDGKDWEFGLDQPGNAGRFVLSCILSNHDSPNAFSLDVFPSWKVMPNSGTIQIELGFSPTAKAQNLMEFDEIYSEFVKRSHQILAG